MMNLTKEECEKALDILKEQQDYLSFMLHSNYPYSIEMIKTVQSCFEQLINEHFSSSETRVETRNNPPLKFDELRPSMWVWDDECVEYIKIHELLGDNTMVIQHDWGNYEIPFQENRFYRREVSDFEKYIIEN